ncbi:hypothetical protein [Trichocoleus sp. FACHB-262]|nr:hypothetical protein [Trichocoleus sp. FACHB-262]
MLEFAHACLVKGLAFIEEYWMKKNKIESVFARYFRKKDDGVAL